MSNNFDQVTDRRASNSIKWKSYGPEVLPLWVADMDFPAPEPVLAALRQVVESGIFGYEAPTLELRETVAARMGRLYGWQISPEAVVTTPGVIAGFHAAARMICGEGQGVLIQPPVYPPFLSVHKDKGLRLQQAEMRGIGRGSFLEYEIDWEILETALNSDGAHTGMFLLCNPHNPTGQVFSRDDEMRIADICIRNDTILCSDEIHSELLLGGSKHVPVASLNPEIADRAITLIAPSKTFNIPGLFCGFAIIQNPYLLKKYKIMVERMALHTNSLGMIAAQTAFSGACDGWLEALKIYLTANRDFLRNAIQHRFPGIKMSLSEGTYLAWLDCRELIKSGRIKDSAHSHFLKEAKVALNEGAEFGPGGEGFVRLNFGCPRITLEQALERMEASLA